MRSPLILVAVCAVVLAGAYFASRVLASDVPAPVGVATVVSMPPDQVQPANIPVIPDRPMTPDLEEARRAMLAPRQGPLQHVNNPAPVPRMEPNAPQPIAEIAPSPFQGESKELDYAEALLAEANPSVDRLQSAHQVLSRCVALEPENKRCQTALTIAQMRLGTKAATERLPGTPTLADPPPNRLK